MKISIALCAAAAVALLTFATPCRAQSYPPAWSAGASYAVGDQVQLNGNVLRAIKAVSPGGFKYASWELWEVRASSTYMIGIAQTFTSLPAAWTFAQNARVADGAYLHFYISSAHGAFNETFSAPFSLDHGSGARMSIIGDNESNVTLTFHDVNGLVIDSGHTFGLLSNLTLVGQTTDISYTGITATRNSTLPAVQFVAITGFSLPIIAEYGASITMNHEGVTQGTYGIQALFGGVINAESCTVTGCTCGVYASDGGIIDISSGSITSCYSGIFAERRGYVNASSATFGANKHIDIEADTAAVVSATSTAPGLHTQTGANDGSFIFP